MSDAKKFLDNMTSYGLGGLVGELADEQLKVIDAVRNTGLAGSVSMTLKFKRTGDEKVAVQAVVKASVPRQPMNVVEMFADEENVLHESNPKAKQLDFENVHAMEDHKKDAAAL